MTPTVNKRDWPHLYVSTLCPLCVGGGYGVYKMWLGSCDAGVFSLREASTVWEQFFPDSAAVMDMAITSTGVIWAAIWGEGLYSYDGSSWKEHPVDSSTPFTSGPRSFDIQCICPDANGGIWVGYGSAIYGVSYFDGTDWSYYSGFGSISNNDYTHCIVITSDGNVWCFGYYASTEANYYNGTTWTHVDYPAPGSISSNSACVDNNDVIWVGMDDYIYKYDSGDWTVYAANGPEGLLYGGYTAIVADDSGNVWVGRYWNSRGYVWYFDGTSWSNKTPSGLESYVRALYLDSSDALWVGTYFDGVWKYKDGGWTQYTHSNSGFASPTDNLYARHIVGQYYEEAPERLARDAQAWREHLIRCHGAPGGMAASHWQNTGQYGDDEGKWDTRKGHLHRFPYKCYACGQSFQTNALLVTHIAEVHLS